jgi:signal peptidase I
VTSLTPTTFRPHGDILFLKKVSARMGGYGKVKIIKINACVTGHHKNRNIKPETAVSKLVPCCRGSLSGPAGQSTRPFA